MTSKTSTSFRISNTEGLDGRAWNASYSTKEKAAEAIRVAMGWDTVVTSGRFQGNHGPEWCAYETLSDMREDLDGARAPRIEAHDWDDR